MPIAQPFPGISVRSPTHLYTIFFKILSTAKCNMHSWPIKEKNLKKVNICICIADSLWFTPEINIVNKLYSSKNLNIYIQHENIYNNGNVVYIYVYIYKIYIQTDVKKKNCCCLVTKSCLTFCHSMDCSTPGSCPPLYFGVCPDSCPLSHWCHLIISSFLAPFSSCPQPFPSSGPFPLRQLFTSGGQSIPFHNLS